VRSGISRREARVAVDNGTATPKQQGMVDRQKAARLRGSATMVTARVAVANDSATPQQQGMVDRQKEGSISRREARVAVDNGTANAEQRGIVQAKQDAMRKRNMIYDAQWEKKYELLRDHVDKHSLKTLKQKDPVRA
jgi:hypothetical protein